MLKFNSIKKQAHAIAFDLPFEERITIMKKNLLCITLSSLFIFTLGACGSGTSSSSPASSTPVVTPVTPPADTTPASPGSSVYTNMADPANATISYPSTSSSGTTSYQTLLLAPSATTTALATAITGGNVILSQSQANAIIFQTPDAVYIVPLPNSSFGNTILAGVASVSTGAQIYGNIAAQVTPQSSALQDSSTIAVTKITLNTNTSTAVFSNNLLTSESGTVPSCNGGLTSAINSYNNNGLNYIGLGTKSGDVCLYIRNQESMNNLTPQAVNHGYTPTEMKAFVFAMSGSNYVGYWQTAAGGQFGGQIWRVTANSSQQPTSFWQLNNPNQQTCNSGACAGQSVTFSNIPSQSIVNSMAVDTANNLYIGTTNGIVYKLGAGLTAWGTTSVSSAPVFVTPQYVANGQGNTLGVVATSQTSSGASIVLNVQ